MIAEQAADLIARIATVPALTNSSGFALGGHGADPALTQVPLPAAWILYSHDIVDESPYGNNSLVSPGMVPSIEVVLGTWSINLYVQYVDQTDLLTVQFPLLESVIKAVRGNQAPSGHKWRYIGQKLALVYPDRLMYEQRYTLTMAL